MLPEGTRAEKVDADGLWLTRAGVSLPIQHSSQGIRTTAALALDMLRHVHSTFPRLPVEHGPDRWVCAAPGVVLIDEIDAHLHVSWQRRIGPWLTARFPRVQFLVTTHSPFICQTASPGGLLRLAPAEDPPIALLDEPTWRAVTQGTLDEGVLTALFGLESPLSEAAAEHREALAQLELRLMDGTATAADIARYKQLKAQLPDSLSTLSAHHLRILRAQRDAP